MNIVKLIILILFGYINCFSQLNNHEFFLISNIQPTIKTINKLENISTIILNSNLINVVAKNKKENKAINYLEKLLNEKNIRIKRIKVNNLDEWNLHFNIIENDNSLSEQYYKIESSIKEKKIVISAFSQLGLLYGVVTFVELVSIHQKQVELSICNIEDYPTVEQRIVSFVPNIDNIESLLDFALKNKIETLAIASRIYPWNIITKNNLRVLQKIKDWKDLYGGPKIMQMHNIYHEKNINLSDHDDISNLLDVIITNSKYGVDKIMILADDTPPFKFGEGYLLPYENEKLKYELLVEAHIDLINMIKKELGNNNISSELFYCPSYYTYEDMNCGDMHLYKDTPWEEKAFQPLTRDLSYIGVHMPEDVNIIWTGPNVRSRKISNSDYKDWTYLLNGRNPFLWDNTIYSHNPYISTPLFTAYNNDFPNDYNLIKKGVFLNGNLSEEDSKVTIITAMDYLWNPSKYNEDKSLKKAINKRYGNDLAYNLLDYRKNELAIRKTIGDRKLWHESDSLWQIIRKAKKIHSKSPYYFHNNYTRMKALRLQLKNSVTNPDSFKEFKSKCIKLKNIRNSSLVLIKNYNEKLYTYLYERSIKIDQHIELPN